MRASTGWSWPGCCCRWSLLAVLSLRQLGALSFWRDEVSSVLFARGSVDELLTIIGRDRDAVGLANMAFYYLVLHFWMSLGDTEEVIRLLSVAFGVAGVVPVYFVARRVGGTAGSRHGGRHVRADAVRHPLQPGGARLFAGDARLGCADLAAAHRDGSARTDLAVAGLRGGRRVRPVCPLLRRARHPRPRHLDPGDPIGPTVAQRAGRRATARAGRRAGSAGHR